MFGVVVLKQLNLMLKKIDLFGVLKAQFNVRSQHTRTLDARTFADKMYISIRSAFTIALLLLASMVFNALPVRAFSITPGFHSHRSTIAIGTCSAQSVAFKSSSGFASAHFKIVTNNFDHFFYSGPTSNIFRSATTDAGLVAEITSCSATNASIISRSHVGSSFTTGVSSELIFEGDIGPNTYRWTLALAAPNANSNATTMATRTLIAGPEINVTGGGASASIPDGDTTPNTGDNTDFGSNTVIGGARQHSFIIENSGSALLTLGASAVTISGAHSGDFSVAAQPATTIDMNTTSFFSITFDPTVAGLRTATISIANDDDDESPYTFDVSGTGTGSIADISIAKNYSVTVVDAGNPISYSFDVTNAGPNTDPAVGVANTFPANSCTYTSVAAGGATGNTAAGAGNLAETLSMPSGSSVTYSAECSVAATGISTLTNTVTVTGSFDPDTNNNSVTDTTAVRPLPTLAMGYSPAIVSVGQTSRLTFTITSEPGYRNIPDTGMQLVLPVGLNIATPANIGATCQSNGNTLNYTTRKIIFYGGSTASGNQSPCTYEIDVIAESSGTYATTSSPLEFVTLSGRPTSPAASANLTVNAVSAPEIEISSSETGVVLDGNTDAHGSEPFGTAKTVTYTITNIGTSTLNLTNAAPTLTGATNVGTPIVGNYTSTAIAAAGTATFTITYTPDSAGAFSFDLDVISDDADEATFDIAVSGTATETTPPRIVSIERSSPTTENTDADTLVWRVTFDENVTGVDNSDFTVTGPTGATIAVSTVIGSTVYDVTITGGDLASFEATATLTVIASGGNIEDTSGNDFANPTPTTTNNNTFIVSNDTIAPTIAIQNAPTTHDRSTPFNVTFEFSEDVTGFVVGDITVGNGAASNFLAVDGNTYTADIKPAGPKDITLDVDAAVAIDVGSNSNTAANQVTIKSTIVEETQTAIADFISNRAGHILNNQPDMIGFITGANNVGGGPLGFLQFDSDLETQTTMSFYTSRSKVLEARKSGRIAPEQASVSLESAERFGLIDDETAVDNDLLQATDEEQLNAQSYQGKNRTGTWDIWTEFHGAQSTQSTIKNKFWTANFGAHYFVNNDILVGLLTEFDWASETNTTTNSKVSGNGYMIGPYIAGKVKDQALFYEARALWGQSLNDITPIGTYTDGFETERWLASLKVQGSYNFGDHMTLEPSVSISYFEEIQKSYTDSLSNAIPEQIISLGEFKFGPTLIRSFDVGSGFTMQTSVGISGVINFGINNANTSTNNAFANEDARARVDAGLELKSEYGIRFAAAGYYDGIGVSGYQSYGGKLGLVIPLN